MRNFYGMALALVLLGCNSELRVHTSGGEIPEESQPDGLASDDPTSDKKEADPTFVGEFAFTHTYVQSRSAISVQLSSELIRSGERFTLWNQTSNVRLLDDEQANFSLTGGSAMHLAGGYALYHFAPPGYSKAFVYGENKLRLDINDAVAPRYATTTITLRDFPIFELGLTHFGENVQTKGNFQGWINMVGQPSVSAQGTTLTVGMPNIVNR